MTDDHSGPEQGQQAADKPTWIDKLESGVISISRVFAMLAWALLGFPVWVVMILVALSFLLLLTFVRAFTARNFSLDRQLLRTVAGSYPNGYRYIKAEFNKIKSDIDDEEPDVGVERSYLYSTAQTLLLLVIAIASYLMYEWVDVLQLSESAYAGALVVVVASLLMAWGADRRKERNSILLNSAADKKSPAVGAPVSSS